MSSPTTTTAGARCARCTHLIGEDRLAALPDTHICVSCSNFDGPDLPPMTVYLDQFGNVDVVREGNMPFASDGCES